MPEIPDLEVIKDFLNERLPGRRVAYAEAPVASIIRSYAAEDFARDVAGRAFDEVSRYGKDLYFPLGDDRLLVVNLMLTGRFHWSEASEARPKRTFFLLGVAEHELRYTDDRHMGRIYYVCPGELTERVPAIAELGPDALDGGVSLDEFTERLRAFTGEIKGILTRGKFLAGIGNAYADEVLFAAGVSPFAKRKELTPDDLRRLHEAVPRVLTEAREVVRERMLPDIHKKVRDFLQVHRRGGEPCPVCGGAVSELTANQRITSYCRRCQPGSLLRGVREHAAERSA